MGKRISRDRSRFFNTIEKDPKETIVNLNRGPKIVTMRQLDHNRYLKLKRDTVKGL